MVENDHITRRTAIKRGAIALGVTSGVGMVGTAAALDGSTVRIEGDGNYTFYIRGNFDDYETEDFEDTIYFDDGNSLYVSGEVSDGVFGFFEDEEDIITLDDTINTTQIEPTPLGIDDDVDVYVDDDQAV